MKKKNYGKKTKIIRSVNSVSGFNEEISMKRILNNIRGFMKLTELFGFKKSDFLNRLFKLFKYKSDIEKQISDPYFNYTKWYPIMAGNKRLGCKSIDDSWVIGAKNFCLVEKTLKVKWKINSEDFTDLKIYEDDNKNNRHKTLSFSEKIARRILPYIDDSLKKSKENLKNLVKIFINNSEISDLIRFYNKLKDGEKLEKREVFINTIEGLLNEIQYKPFFIIVEIIKVQPVLAKTVRIVNVLTNEYQKHLENNDITTVIKVFKALDSKNLCTNQCFEEWFDKKNDIEETMVSLFNGLQPAKKKEFEKPRIMYFNNCTIDELSKFVDTKLYRIIIKLFKELELAIHLYKVMNVNNVPESLKAALELHMEQENNFKKEMRFITDMDTNADGYNLIKKYDDKIRKHQEKIKSLFTHNYKKDSLLEIVGGNKTTTQLIENLSKQNIEMAHAIIYGVIFVENDKAYEYAQYITSIIGHKNFLKLLQQYIYMYYASPNKINIKGIIRIVQDETNKVKFLKIQIYKPRDSLKDIIGVNTEDFMKTIIEKYSVESIEQLFNLNNEEVYNTLQTVLKSCHLSMPINFRVYNNLHNRFISIKKNTTNSIIDYEDHEVYSYKNNKQKTNKSFILFASSGIVSLILVLLFFFFMGRKMKRNKHSRRTNDASDNDLPLVNIDNSYGFRYN